MTFENIEKIPQFTCRVAEVIHDAITALRTERRISPEVDALRLGEIPLQERIDIVVRLSETAAAFLMWATANKIAERDRHDVMYDFLEAIAEVGRA
jgi:hypothetical protein